jgi:hypothetical protein
MVKIAVRAAMQGRYTRNAMRINAAISILMLPCLLIACGSDLVSATASDTASSTTNVSSEGSGSEAGSESGTQSDSESDSETETGEPSTPCESCSEDELCVAHADDACNAEFGYTLECVPAVAACATGECDPDCLEAVCGNNFCTPPCGQVPGVDVWCSGQMWGSCDPMAQDCPEGEKCVPWASQGENWDATKCVPVTGDNMVGESCEYAGAVEATDDCDENGWCFGVDVEGMGTCYGFCDPGETCPDGQSCLVANQDSIALCIDTCVPHHSENCAAGTVCVPNGFDGVFMCMPGQTLPADAPCESGDYCPLGQACVPAFQLEGCMGESCCTDWCDTSEPDPCEPPLSCQAVMWQGEVPAGLETAGVCRLG